MENFEKPFLTVDILLFNIESGFVEGLFIGKWFTLSQKEVSLSP
ncbi:MAG: hypothetical protein OEV44_11855 [Spirochaetota bacterium]|nr:hypothetical protein [Spirochaetota bacterium]